MRKIKKIEMLFFIYKKSIKLLIIKFQTIKFKSSKMNSITSIYIPRMSAFYTEEAVKNIMFNLRIGIVKRVDFIPINKKPGFVEKVDDVYKSAFVFFELPIRRDDKIYLPDEIHKSLRLRNENIWDMVANTDDDPCRIRVGLNEYWFILQNKNPVTETMMNIHQVVENGRHLEGLIEKQNKKLEEQDATIKKLESKLDGIHAVVYQLIGGLFNQGNQREELEQHINCLFPGTTHEYTEDALPEKNKWTIYPTTRQGDECEKRVEALEQTVRDMLKFDFHEPQEHYEEHYDEEELSHRCNINYIHNESSSSTHSSMSDLVDDDDASTTTHSSMPELIDDVSSLESGERIRNSFELCGNE